MKKILPLALLVVVLTSFKSDKNYFVGMILYKNAYTDLKGNNIMERIAPFVCREQHYFIDGKNYKAYDEHNNWVQLYNSATNTYYYFNKDKTATRYDGATVTSQNFVVTKLDTTEKIAGYDCQAIQVERDNSTTIYFFRPAIKTDARAFSRHHFGEWNRYLETTGGALSLKFIMKDHKNGYIWTSTATEVKSLKLEARDFVFPED